MTVEELRRHLARLDPHLPVTVADPCRPGTVDVTGVQVDRVRNTCPGPWEQTEEVISDRNECVILWYFPSLNCMKDPELEEQTWSLSVLHIDSVRLNGFRRRVQEAVRRLLSLHGSRTQQESST